MTPLDATITFKTYFQDQTTKVERMNIRVDNELINEKSWQQIKFKPGSYRIYMDKYLDFEKSELAIVDTFEITIKPGEKYNFIKLANIKSN